MPQVDDKVVLIRGGTSGIGAATVLRMTQGANVLFTGRQFEQANRIIRLTEHNRGKVAFVPAPTSVSLQRSRNLCRRLSQPLVASTLRSTTLEQWERGACSRKSEEVFDHVFAVNVKAVFLLLESELRFMVEQHHGGSIVNTASVNGMIASPGYAPYVASKHAVLGLTKSAAVEYGQHGIRVNAVSPATIRTQLLRDASEEAVDTISASHPLLRIGTSEEVAETVVWLFSDSSSYVTGQSLVLDGGLTAQRPAPVPTVVGSTGAWDNCEFSRSAAAGSNSGV
jgi:A-factor type gamma-butyrolactone 1'-reductase (1S-forming)